MPCNIRSGKTTACWKPINCKETKELRLYILILTFANEEQRQNTVYIKTAVLGFFIFNVIFSTSKNTNWIFFLEFTACFKPLIFGLLFNGHMWRGRGGRRLWVAMISGKLSHVVRPIPKVLFKERVCIRRGYEPRITRVTVRGQEVLVGVRMWPSESGITANQKYCSKNV